MISGMVFPNHYSVFTLGWELRVMQTIVQGRSLPLDWISLDTGLVDILLVRIRAVAIHWLRVRHFRATTDSFSIQNASSMVLLTLNTMDFLPFHLSVFQSHCEKKNLRSHSISLTITRSEGFPLLFTPHAPKQISKGTAMKCNVVFLMPSTSLVLDNAVLKSGS